MLRVFLHIPRTGGTSFRLLLEQQFTKNQIISIYGDNISDSAEYMRSLPPWVIGNAEVLRGHIQYGVHKYIDRPVSYATVIRDPVERVHSLWRYILGTPGHYLHNLVIQHNFAWFVRSGVSLETDNGQCRQLSGICGDFEQVPFAKSVVPFGQAGQDILSAVMSNILDGMLVGTTCELGQFVRTVSKFWQLSLSVTKVPHVNSSAYRNTFTSEYMWLTDADRELVLEYNKQDKILYDTTVRGINDDSIDNR